MLNFENTINLSKQGLNLLEAPKITSTFFNTSVSLCISLPYNTTTLKDIINKEFKEYIKIDGSSSSTYFSLGFILAYEMLVNNKIAQFQNTIEKLTNSLNCRLLYSNFKSSLNDNFTKVYFSNMKYLYNVLRSNRQLLAKEDKKKVICKIILDELKKNKDFLISTVQIVRSSVYSFIVGMNEVKNEELLDKIRAQMWDLPKTEEIAFIRYFNDCYGLPVTIMNLTDSKHEFFTSSNNQDISSTKYYFLSVSGKKNFKGIVFPNHSLEDENIFPGERASFKESTSSTVVKKGKDQDDFEVYYSKSAKKSTCRSPFEREVNRRIALDDIPTNCQIENYQKSDNLNCSLCGNKPSDEVMTSNPGCGHKYCMACLTSLVGNSMENCFVKKCSFQLDKKIIIDFLLTRQSREGDVTFNLHSSQKFDVERDTPRISEDTGFIKLNVDIITCPVTNQKYNSHDNLPRMLPCGHTVSEKALRKILDGSKTMDFRCPIDKKSFMKLKGEDFAVNASLLNIVIEVEKSQEKLDSMKNKLYICIDQIDNWIDSSIDIQKKERAHFMKEVESKFNEVIELINKKKEEILLRIESDFEISKQLNRDDEDILNSLRRRFEGEIECLEELKLGYCQVSDTGRNGFESSLQKIQETFENAKNEPQKFYDYYFKSCIIDAIYKLLNDGTVFLAEEGKHRLIQF